MPAECCTFEDWLESIIYWDTSFIIAYIEENAPFHDECRWFVDRMKRESILPVISDFVYNEVAFHIFKTTLTIEGNRTGRYWLDVKRDNPELLLETMPTVETHREKLDQMTFQLPISENVKSQAFYLMRSYPLLPTDVYHIATALESNVTAFVTLDRDFFLVDDIIVYTCLPN